MAEKKIRSAPQIIKEYIESLENDSSLDKSTIEVLMQLHAASKAPTQTRLLQALEMKRKESGIHG